jgi:TonB family protein
MPRSLRLETAVVVIFEAVLLGAALTFSGCRRGSKQASEDKGSCPATPAVPKPETVHPESAPHGHTAVILPNSKYSGTVYLLTAISNKGNVCDVQLIRGFDKDADAKAMQAVRQWHFYPDQKDGRPVSVVMTLGIPIWRDADGQLYLGTSGNSVR